MNVRDRQAVRTEATLDAGLGLILATALALQAVAIAASWGGSYWQFGCVVGATMSVIALVRRRHRTMAAAAGLTVAAIAMLIAQAADLPAEPGLTSALALSVLVGSAIRRLSGPPAGLLAAMGLVIVAGSWIVFPSPTSALPPVTALNGAAVLTSLVVGLFLRLFDTRRHAIIETLRRDERLELARELHDVVAHHITGIVVQAQAAHLIARRQPDTALADSLESIESAGSEALASMRRVLGLLRDADGAAAAPYPESISDLVKRFGSHGCEVHLHTPDDESSWPLELRNTIYRVVQESLTNVARHAPDAHSVAINVTEGGQSVTVEVIDDATTRPNRYQRGGFGLIGMRERVETLGGTLQAGPRSENGWSVLVTLPLPDRAAR